MLPAGARTVFPPLHRIVERHGSPGGTEDGGTRFQLVGGHARIVAGLQRTLRHRHIAGRLDEGREHRVGHRRAIHPEPIDPDGMRRQRVRHVARLASHPEGAAWHPHHALGRGPGAAAVFTPTVIPASGAGADAGAAAFGVACASCALCARGRRVRRRHDYRRRSSTAQPGPESRAARTPSISHLIAYATPL